MLYSITEAAVDEETNNPHGSLTRFVNLGQKYFPETVEEKYRAIYYEGIDLCVNKIKERLNQPGYASYRRLESLLLKAAAGETQ